MPIDTNDAPPVETPEARAARLADTPVVKLARLEAAAATGDHAAAVHALLLEVVGECGAIRNALAAGATDLGAEFAHAQACLEEAKNRHHASTAR